MLVSMFNYLRVKLANKKGQGMVEYGLIVGVIAVIVVAALTVLREPLIDFFESIGDYLETKYPTDPTV